tara:strand:- start:2756 stop:3412 length:657 start_codon:yes stop_codon:yes gene_type:complete
MKLTKQRLMEMAGLHQFVTEATKPVVFDIVAILDVTYKKPGTLGNQDWNENPQDVEKAVRLVLEKNDKDPKSIPHGPDSGYMEQDASGPIRFYFYSEQEVETKKLRGQVLNQSNILEALKEGAIAAVKVFGKPVNIAEKSSTSSKEVELGKLLDTMMDDEDAMDQGLAPSEAIDYEEIQAQAKRLGIRLDIKKLQDFAKNNDEEFVYSGLELIRATKK